MTLSACLLLFALAGQVQSAQAPQANPYSGIEAWRVGVGGNAAHKKLAEQVSEMVKGRGLRVVSWSSRRVGLVVLTITAERTRDRSLSGGVVVVSIMRPVLTLQPWGPDKMVLATVWSRSLFFMATADREHMVITQTWRRGLKEALDSIAAEKPTA